MLRGFHFICQACRMESSLFAIFTSTFYSTPLHIVYIIYIIYIISILSPFSTYFYLCCSPLLPPPPPPQQQGEGLMGRQAGMVPLVIPVSVPVRQGQTGPPGQHALLPPQPQHKPSVIVASRRSLRKSLSESFSQVGPVACRPWLYSLS